MKVLIITSYLTSKAHPKLLRNKTGYGYMIHDISKSIGAKEDVDVFCVAGFIPDLDVDGFHIIGQSWLSWLYGVKILNVWNAILFLKRYRLPIVDSLRVLFYNISLGQLEGRLGSYDIVHIHECGYITDAVLNVCRRIKKPVLTTLHGLNSFEDAIDLHPSLKKYERDFLIESYIKQIPLSFISTGIMVTSMKWVESITSKSDKVNYWKVICNGCDTSILNKEIDLREKYGISKDSFVFSFVGNVSVNKNQLQVARSYLLLPKGLQEKIHVLFVGNYTINDDVYKFIKSNNLAGHLHICGAIPSSEVHNYYQSSDATILTSKSEGFGLSIVEGYVYGLPNLTFGNLAAVPDLYNKETMIKVDNRDDYSLADGMIQMISKKWDKEFIKRFANNFSLNKMADSYIEFYKDISDINN